LSDNAQSIIKSLEPLFEKAEKEKLIFLSNYQSIKFPPKELRKAHKDGRFIWGPANWRLVKRTTFFSFLKSKIKRTIKVWSEWNYK
jgi:hypothetical protein